MFSRMYTGFRKLWERLRDEASNQTRSAEGVPSSLEITVQSANNVRFHEEYFRIVLFTVGVLHMYRTNSQTFIVFHIIYV